MDEKLKMLIQQIKDGDENAFAEFYRLTVRFIYSIVYAYLLSREDTEDVIQDTYLKLYMIRKRINSDQSIMMYMKRIAINYAFKQMRHRKVMVVEETAPSGDSEVNELVYEAMKKLKDKDRMVIALHYLSNASIKEISMLVGEKEGSVKSRLFRARNKLKEAIRSELS